MNEKKRGGRIRYGKEEWRVLVSEFAASDLDREAFCQQRGIGVLRLDRWRAFFKNECHAEVPPSRGGSASFVDLGPLKATSTLSSHLELKLDLGGGIVLSLTRG